MPSRIVGALRQPEYTGENRCAPCTALNLVIATLFASLISRQSKYAAIFLLIVSSILIYLRGYLIPKTPELTKRHFPPTILRWFGKDPEIEVADGFSGGMKSSSTLDTSSAVGPDKKSTASDESTGDSRTTISTVESGDREPGSSMASLETYLLERNIVEPCADDLCLTGWFENLWLDEIDVLVDSDITVSEVIEVFDIESEKRQFELVTRDESWILRSQSKQFGQWPSRAALTADIAASRVLQSEMADWENYSPSEKGQLLNSIRMFLETCPTTGGEIQIGEEVVESCCGSHKVIAVVCEETGERLFEHRQLETRS